jgi:hypothetical protein
MSFGKAVLAAFLGTVLAGVFLLAYRASQETQKGLFESFTDVPGEAKKVYVDVQSKATDAVKRVRDTGAGTAESMETGDWPETDYIQGGSVQP